jgi:hypothetical protein
MNPIVTDRIITTLQAIRNASRDIEMPILATATGPARVKLTEANIHLMQAGAALIQVIALVDKENKE